MATYRVRDRSGGTLEVSSKEQADYWVGFGYQLVEGDEKPKQARRTTARSTPAVSCVTKKGTSRSAVCTERRRRRRRTRHCSTAKKASATSAASVSQVSQKS